jgi:hypothetical protein
MLVQPKVCWQSGLVYIREVLKAEADFAGDYTLMNFEGFV